MGQTTRSQGISFTHEMWARIESRCSELKVGRSTYFQMLAEWDLRFMPERYAHKSDGRWHFFPEQGAIPLEEEPLKAAEDPAPEPARPRRKRR